MIEAWTSSLVVFKGLGTNFNPLERRLTSDCPSLVSLRFTTDLGRFTSGVPSLNGRASAPAERWRFC